LGYASEDLRDDREVVLESVRRSGVSLQHASEDLRADREVVDAACAESRYAGAYSLVRPHHEVVLEQYAAMWAAEDAMLAEMLAAQEDGEL